MRIIIRAFLLERGVAVRQGLRFLRNELPGILAGPSDALSSRMVLVLTGNSRRVHSHSISGSFEPAFISAAFRLS